MIRHYSDEIGISSWEAFVRFQARFEPSKNWIFRGQVKWEWPLKTSLERAAESYGLQFDNLPRIEQGLIRKFQRHYHHFSADRPKDDDYIEWLSIMQHYGSPTRLLDFTYSIFIALFFAVVDSEVHKEAALWCVDSDWLHDKYMKTTRTEYVAKFRDDISARYLETHKIALNDRIRFLYCVNPFRMNPRLTIQQGAFLVPLEISKPFMKNLEATVTDTSETSKILKVKLVLHDNFLNSILTNLHRMNVTRAALFPGLEGFAQYLKMLTKIPNAIHTNTDKFL
jgi:hypothetical protein